MKFASSIFSLLVTGLFVAILAVPAYASPEPVQWTNIVNASVSGSTLTKTGGCDGCPDAGGQSAQQIVSDDGYFEFTVTNASLIRYAGVSNGEPGTEPERLHYSWRIYEHPQLGAIAEVREQGTYQTEVVVTDGDRLRIASEAGLVNYYHNSNWIYTSTASPTYPLTADASLLNIGSEVSDAMIAGHDATTAPGGLIELAGSHQARGMLDDLSFLPSTRGAFTFPEPYNTRGIRLTTPEDAPDLVRGQQGVQDVGYAYWRNMNNHVNDEEIFIFLSLLPADPYGGPTLFRFNKLTEVVTKEGPLFSDPAHELYYLRNSAADGWYFSATLPNILYVRDDSRLVRYDVITRTSDVVFDVIQHFGPGHDIRQMHSSNNDLVHSFTLHSTVTGDALGCGIYDEVSQGFQFFPRLGGSYDECQIDQGGNWLLIKENVTGQHGVDNRIINLQTGQERQLLDPDGAGGHSDLGYGHAVMVDNWDSVPHSWKLWQFQDGVGNYGPTDFLNRSYYNETEGGTVWSVPAPNHVSWRNARANVPLAEQYAVGSAGAAEQDPPINHAHEIIAFRMGGSRDVLVIAPDMTDLTGLDFVSAYTAMPKGNVDVTGQYYIWTSNMGGSGRLDAFLVRVPSHKLFE